MILLDSVSVQDRDLLARMTQYFGSLESRIQEGQGWLIFNADRSRTGRITKFVLDRLAERRPFVSYYHVPWRDFALNAYMTKIELPAATASEASTEYDIAGRVSRDQQYHMRYADVLLLSGLRPEHQHELEHVETVLGDRLTKRLPSIVVTPLGPEVVRAWGRLYDGMYSTSLLAL